MNYGRCRTCWWYKEIQGRKYTATGGKLLEQEGHGYCLMQSVPYEQFFYPIRESSYCPDHWNRKKEKQTLEEWMKINNIILPDN